MKFIDLRIGEFFKINGNRFLRIKISDGFTSVKFNSFEINPSSGCVCLTGADADVTRYDGTFEPVPDPVLTNSEKAYLEDVIRPWKSKVQSIYKDEDLDLSMQFISIVIIYEKLVGSSYIALPLFEKETMYKGMEQGLCYSLKELGLFEDESK